MRAVFALLLLTGAAASSADPNTPVGRVVKLLSDLSVQIEQEGKKEEDLYETYVCWAKSIISQKTASNEAANSRINELEQYIADIAAGRVEFTSERQDLTKELEELNADIEAATAMREREKADFEEAAHEMDQTITALQSAIDVLKEATAEHQQGTMLLAQSGVTALREATSAAALQRAVQLGQRFLTKGDSLFLRRLLSGEVPTADWKKLNRKATFKMSYKARSGKIQSVLASLLATFEENLKDATDKEAKAQSTYDKLMETKHEQKASTEEALLKMEEENGVRGMTVEESQAEVDALKEQVANDTKYIAQVEKSLAEKKEEWKTRQALRAGEIQAMSKAISILHSDDARDLMKKSYGSQGFSFVQVYSGKGSAAAAALREAARGADASHRGRILALASRATAPSHFKAVVEAIDNMVAVLNAEEAEDLEIKERCESDRSRDSREAAVTSRDIDEMTDNIAKLERDIEEIKATIADKQQQIKDNQEELAEATRIREAEQSEFEVQKKYDQDAHALILSSRDVLQKFYSENGLMLVQQHKGGKSPFVSEAGKAPPPPPATWEAPYGGKTDESTGVISILGMLAEDVEKDIAAATAAENEAIAAYEETKSGLEASIAALQADIVALEATQADKEAEIESTKGDRRESKKALGAVMETLAKAAPGCDFFAVNYQVRTRNRQVELDGLQKAKAILEGAAFSKVDENRELKPGDAFLQRVHQHQ